MALRLFERTLASVRTDLGSLYVRDVDHGFRLDLIDLDEFVGGLKSALRKQRDENKELRAKFEVTPDGAEALALWRDAEGDRRQDGARRACRTATTENAAAVHGRSVMKRLAGRMYTG